MDSDKQVWHLSAFGKPACGADVTLAASGAEPVQWRSVRCTICECLDEHWRKTRVRAIAREEGRVLLPWQRPHDIGAEEPAINEKDEVK